MPKDILQLSKDINSILKKDLENKLNNIAKDMIDKTKNNIRQEVYSVYNPSKYERTYNLERSISKSKVEDTGNKLIISVFSDDSIAQSYHMYNPKEPLEPYAANVELGIYDYNYPYTYNKPREFMKKTYEENKQFIVNKINKTVKDFTEK